VASVAAWVARTSEPAAAAGGDTAAAPLDSISEMSAGSSPELDQTERRDEQPRHQPPTSTTV